MLLLVLGRRAVGKKGWVAKALKATCNLTRKFPWGASKHFTYRNPIGGAGQLLGAQSLTGELETGVSGMFGVFPRKQSQPVAELGLEPGALSLFLQRHMFISQSPLKDVRGQKLTLLTSKWGLPKHRKSECVMLTLCDTASETGHFVTALLTCLRWAPSALRASWVSAGPGFCFCSSFLRCPQTPYPFIAFNSLLIPKGCPVLLVH